MTISVDGYVIDNSSDSGSYSLQAPVQGVGYHTITITAQSATDSASDSCVFVMNDQSDSGDDYGYDFGYDTEYDTGYDTDFGYDPSAEEWETYLDLIGGDW